MEARLTQRESHMSMRYRRSSFVLAHVTGLMLLGAMLAPAAVAQQPKSAAGTVDRKSVV